MNSKEFSSHLTHGLRSARALLLCLAPFAAQAQEAYGMFTLSVVPAAVPISSRVAPVPTVSTLVMWGLAMAIVLLGWHALRRHSRRGASLALLATLLLAGNFDHGLTNTAQANNNVQLPVFGLAMDGVAEFGLPVAPLPAGLFEVRTTPGMPFGTIFLGDGRSAPSFIAQVFGSTDAAPPAAAIGSGLIAGVSLDAGVFGNSPLSGIFRNDTQDDVQFLELAAYTVAGSGMRGIFSSDSFDQQAVAAKAGSTMPLCAPNLQLKTGERCMYLFVEHGSPPL